LPVVAVVPAARLTRETVPVALSNRKTSVVLLVSTCLN
jgi:hypothetical protein